MRKRAVRLIISISLIFIIKNASFAQANDNPGNTSVKKEPELVTRTVTPREIQGEISALSKRYIAVVFDKDKDGVDLEMSYPVDQNVKFEHKHALSEFQVGDTVYLQFDELKEESKGASTSRRTLKLIGYIRSAPKPPEPVEPVTPAPEENSSPEGAN